jgi:hypothetical protein
LPTSKVLNPEALALLMLMLEKYKVTMPLQRAVDFGLSVSLMKAANVVKRISNELETLANATHAIEHGELDAATDAALRGAFRESFDWLRWSAPAVALFRITLANISLSTQKPSNRLPAPPRCAVLQSCAPEMFSTS